MQRFLLSLLLFAFAANAGGAAAKPFRRVLVLTGGSLEFGTYLGVLRGLQSEGWEPDLVVTTCGSSMIAALLQSQPTAQDAEDFFFSADFYEALHTSTHVDKGSGLRALSRVYLKDNRKHFPHIFGRTILDVSVPSPLPSFSKPLDSVHPRVLMLATRMHHGAEVQGQAWSKLGPGVLQEVFLTDHDTAALIPPFTSPLNEWSNRIASETAVLSDWDTWQAFRVSIADPYLLAPLPIGEDHFATGAIDIVPVELATSLGDDVIITSTGDMESANSRGFENLFGFGQNERARWARAQQREGLRWVDLNDDVKVYRESGISPILSGWLPLPGQFLRIKDHMPKSYDEFVRKMRSEFQYGASRAAEALRPSN